MEKQEMKNGQNSQLIDKKNDRLSSVLLIGAIILYSVSLVLLANLVLAEESGQARGALIKVNSTLDGNVFDQLSATVKSVNGNILAIDILSHNFSLLQEVEGVCAARMDAVSDARSNMNVEAIKRKYAGADVVVGVLDNTGRLSDRALTDLKKIDLAGNTGFLSYRSQDPNSTVIMRNLKHGESNLIQTLSYMRAYAETVEKPLVVEMILAGAELSNPLFMQVCQKNVDAGIQFLGTGSSNHLFLAKEPVQIAFSMLNPNTGEVTDRTDFWAPQEVPGRRIMLLGSDDNDCLVHFKPNGNLNNFQIANSSQDLIMVTALSSSGEVNYFHLSEAESYFEVIEGITGGAVLANGKERLHPFYSKMALFNEDAGMEPVYIGEANDPISVRTGTDMTLSVTTLDSGRLSMALNNLDSQLEIHVKDGHGTTLYSATPDTGIRSLRTEFSLPENAPGMYYLDLSSPTSHRSVALRVE